MARRLNVAVVTSALLLVAAVVFLCSPGASAARQAQVEMAGALQVPAGGEAGEDDGSVAAASKRLSPGGPDPQHH
ncbi:hypothetical protein HU200_036863 [Digitaria exilis]|uniref:Uncharacterized protein n=1 Tax=Digitaria exilis TaxID=1010633 RepID=A0A835BEL9_9POAL|nr:hypothetical protein HU200_036863 [Digitaria exilis]